MYVGGNMSPTGACDVISGVGITLLTVGEISLRCPERTLDQRRQRSSLGDGPEVAKIAIFLAARNGGLMTSDPEVMRTDD